LAAAVAKPQAARPKRAPHGQDHSANELERRKQLKIRLRRDLAIEPQKYEGKTYFVIKDRSACATTASRTTSITCCSSSTASRPSTTPRRRTKNSIAPNGSGSKTWKASRSSS